MDAGPSGGAGPSRRAPGAGWSDRLDGRLDLDHLDDDGPLDLDVLSHEDDGPSWLERSGIAPWARRHPALATAVVVVVAAAIVAPSAVGALRPEPVPDSALVTVTTGGNEAARLTVDPETGHITEISQLVLVTSSEAPDVSVQALGVVGPGLADPRARVIAATADSPATGPVRSSLDCDGRDATRAVLSAGPGDYQVSLRLTSSATGEVRETSVPLSGAEEWLTDIRRACVQIAADRDLVVVDAQAEPVTGNVAADVRLLVRSRAREPWRSVHVSTVGGPQVVAVGTPVDVPAGGEAWVPARLWPDDCSNSVGALSQGVPLRADVDDRGTATEARSPTFRLRLDSEVIDKVAYALSTVCSSTPPTITVDDAGVSQGASDTSAGSLDLRLTLRTEQSGRVEVVEPLSADEGRVIPLVDNVPVQDGVAILRVRWELPQCFALLQQGGPVLRVRIASDLRRPYVLPLRGDTLVEHLVPLCGRTVGSTVR